ncbi:MAG: SsrA-binding protein SmpB [Ignavibacteriae bacterium]|nr:SsrA-binding protein SmpB [Ignavibacteriota bacterium]
MQIPPKTERRIHIIAQNKKARHEFEILYTVEAGIALTGTEVKSLRQGKCNFQDSYAGFLSNANDEMTLINLHISVYDHGNRENHQPQRPRKLLIHAKEAIKLRAAIQEKGLTIVPLALYFSGPYVKIELGIARGKKLYDKREDLKQRQLDREMRRDQ